MTIVTIQNNFIKICFVEHVLKLGFSPFPFQAYYTHANKAHLYHLNGRWFCCDECNKFFPNKPVLDSHKSTVHSKADLDKRRAEKVTCEFCAQTLRNRAVSLKIISFLKNFQIKFWISLVDPSTAVALNKKTLNKKNTNSNVWEHILVSFLYKTMHVSS